MARTRNCDAPKARQILKGAKSAFIELGYEGTSVDEIARRAGVSKATVYSHFEDKKALFIAFVGEDCREINQRLVRPESADRTAADSLHEIALNYIQLVISPEGLAMFRLIVGETQRFPEVGREFYDAGPGVTRQRLADLFVAADARKELRIEDAALAADQFLALCRAELLEKRLFGLNVSVTQTGIERMAERAVATFMKVYRR